MTMTLHFLDFVEESDSSLVSRPFPLPRESGKSRGFWDHKSLQREVVIILSHTALLRLMSFAAGSRELNHCITRPRKILVVSVCW